MNLQKELNLRANNQCELCASTDNLNAYHVPNAPNENLESHALICQNCQNQLENPDQVTPNHWRCLNDSMWSQIPAVQVLSWRMLHRLKNEGWTQDLLDMMYLSDEVLDWAKSTETLEGDIVHKDSNGNILEAGDTVTLIQDLKVKGANFTAKRGTAVRRISLVHDNPEHIEGKVDEQHIIILTKYVKKQNK